MDASVCTAIATQHTNTSGVVEVRLNSIRTADVLVDGEIIGFDESNAHQFPGDTIYSRFRKCPYLLKIIISSEHILIMNVYIERHVVFL